jgi:lipopolysaccharide biosynthesis protein
MPIVYLVGLSQVGQDLLDRPDVAYGRHSAVMPGRDNTTRRCDFATIFVNAVSEIYEVWLHEVIALALECRRPEERLVFINAWNEWAEGAHLEPDQRYGHQFLEATLRALTGAPVGGTPYLRMRGEAEGRLG